VLASLISQRAGDLGIHLIRGMEAFALASGQVPHEALPTDQALHAHIGCFKAEHGPAAPPAIRSLIDPDMIHQKRLGKGRAGIGTSSPPPPDRDVEDQKERVVEHPP
jgi:hypothetical protein